MYDPNKPETWHAVVIPRKSVESMPGVTTDYPPEYKGTGWVNDPAAVKLVTDAWEARGMIPTFAGAAPGLMREASDDRPVFFWDAELAVLGRQLDTWNQRQVGSCVGFGKTRSAQDLLLWEIAAGEPEVWPGAELAPEVTYGGSRVEVGGGRVRGDGSVGVWADEFLMRWGVVKRGRVGGLDLTEYDEITCRRLGRDGIPADVEAEAKLHPVKAAALVVNGEEAWAAVGGGKPVTLCSDQGFSMTLGSDGFCSPSGVWNHCMAVRGRFVSPKRGRSCVLGNSWADYLRGGSRTFEYVAEDGSVKTKQLPPGHFCVAINTIDRMCRQRDSSALAGFSGWKRTTIDYTP